MDSVVSHNITDDLNNLFIHSFIQNMMLLKLTKKPFILKDTLCVPNLCKNLILCIALHHKIMHLLNFIFFSCKGRDLGGDSSKRCIQKLCFCLLGITDGIFPLNGC